MDVVGDQANCVVIRSRQKSIQNGYLDMFAFYFDKKDYDLLIGIGDDENPFALPRAIVELENSFDINKIAYCLWKTICVRAPIRVLICHQKNMDKKLSLAKHLEEIIWQRSLMRDDKGDLLVIIGNDKKGENSWEDYFSVFEWRSNRLEKIEGIEW